MTETDWLCARRRPVPLAASMPDSVAMNGWMFIRVTMKPLMIPTARPAPRPPRSPGRSPIGDNSAETTLAKAAVVPTERSIPAVMITKHMPRLVSANIEL